MGIFKRMLLCVGLFGTVVALAQEPQWLRYPSISPDGHTIAFVYRGGIWLVPAEGGDAVLLTYGDSYNSHPIWSHDSKQIAYTSDKYGKSDVFLAAIDSNDIERLTYHSGEDVPLSFTADDSGVIFSSDRLGDSGNVRDSLRGVTSPTSLFEVSIKTNKISTFLPLHANQLNIDRHNAQRFLYEDNVAPFRTVLRKHNRSAASNKVWLFDPETQQHQQLTNHPGDSQNPIFAPDGKSFYYLNDTTGSLNVWQKNISTGEEKQVTFFKQWPVRFLSMADDGTLVFSYDGKLWRKGHDAEPQTVTIDIKDRYISSKDTFLDVSAQVSEIAISPSNQEIALIARGEVFVLNLYNEQVRQITDTVGMERFLSFSPDGRSLLYASEDSDGWKIKQASLVNKDAAGFSGVTAFEETVLVDEKEDAFQPKYSPDGQQIAYVYDRDKIKVLDLSTRQSRLILDQGYIYTYFDGDVSFSWGKNSQWLIVQSGGVTHLKCYLVDVSGQTAPQNISMSGFNNTNPTVSDDGSLVLWESDEFGLRQTDAKTGLVDLMAVFLTPEGLRDYTNAVNKQAPYEAAKKIPEGLPDLKHIDRREVRLTPFSMGLRFYQLSPDNQTLLVVAGETAYLIDTLAKEIRRSFDLPPALSYQVNNDFSTLYVLGRGRIAAIGLKNESTKTFNLDVGLHKDLRAEARAIFEHNFRATQETFYDKAMHGVDWDAVGAHYRKFLPHISNFKDLAELLEEMQGELNASHLKAGFPSVASQRDDTASLGVYFDFGYDGDGVKVKSVLSGGPADTATSHLTPGAIVLAINGQAITARDNVYKQLNHKVGQPILLKIQTSDGATVEESIVPVSRRDENTLVYEAWKSLQQQRVAELSDNHIAYVHLPGMNVDAYRDAYKQVFGKHPHSQGVIIDVRDNQGGHLTDQLLTLLTGQRSFSYISRNNELVAQMPADRFARPTVVIANQNSYSDGSIFPTVYQYEKIGKVVGSKVPGTGTFVTSVRQLFPHASYTIPILGLRLTNGEFLENKELTPDVLIDNDPNSIVKGEDVQLKKAVEVLQETIKDQDNQTKPVDKAN